MKRLKVLLTDRDRKSIPVPTEYRTADTENYSPQMKETVVDEVCMAVRTLEEAGIYWRACVDSHAFTSGEKSLLTLLADAGVHSYRFSEGFQGVCETSTAPKGVATRENQKALLRRRVWVSAMTFSMILENRAEEDHPMFVPRFVAVSRNA
ncbi:MAG: hypothetical protein Q8P86_02875 [bacterium]|nr:hypothetical protein [bacterium]